MKWTKLTDGLPPYDPSMRVLAYVEDFIGEQFFDVSVKELYQPLAQNTPSFTHWTFRPIDEIENGEDLRQEVERFSKDVRTMIEQRKYEDEFLSKLMERMFIIKRDEDRDEWRHEVRMMCIEHGWCIHCNEYHADGFCPNNEEF